MNNFSTKIYALFLLSICSFNSFGQTPGNLTFSFTEVSKPASSTYNSLGKHVLAVWIQSGTGTFIKTKMRYAGGGTSDHLPTWAVNSGGPASNCMSASCNVVSASTGATKTSFAARSITWDGTDVNGNVVADGTYKVTIQETWAHTGSGTATRSITFTKGPSLDSQVPADDANFSGLALQWLPSANSIEETTELAGITIYPNPSTDGLFTIDYAKASNIKVLNIQGLEIYNETLTSETGSKSVDLSNFTNGIYFICVTDGVKTSKFKVTLEK